MAKKAERPLPDNLEIPFIICDNTVNRYGWRLLVEGIDTEGFMKNPVCCVQHDTDDAPIGKWKDLKVENQQLRGVLQFDRNDEDAVKLYWKYTDGYMSAVSLNVIVIEESDDVKYLVPGQRYSTFVKTELLEVSVVTLPGQKNAVKLSTPTGETYTLKLVTINTENMADDKKTVEQYQQENLALRKLNADNLVALHKLRGVVAEAEVEPLLQLALENYETVKKMLNAKPTPVAIGNHGSGGQATVEGKEQLADQLVKLHFDRGAITAEEKAIYKSSALANFDATKKVLEAKTGREGVQTFVQGMQGASDGAKSVGGEKAWTYLDYYKKDLRALSLMEKNEPERFKKLEADFRASAVADGTIMQAE